MKEPCNKILVVNVNWLGDVIFSLPIFRALKTAYPKAHIACLAVPRVREILEAAIHVNEIILYEEDGRHKSPLGKLKLILELKKQNFDIAFLLHRSLTRALFVFLAGIPRRVGYDTKGRGFLLTHKAKPLSEMIHRSDYYLNVIESFGIKVDDRRCELAVSSQAQEDMRQLLSQKGINQKDFVVVVHAGGNWDLKRWPPENFAGTIEHLSRQEKTKIIIVGTQKDAALAREISSLSRTNPIILAGQTTLRQLMALMQRADVVLSADSGPLHLACGLGTKTIALFGPTRPEVTGPRGTGRAVILQKDVGCNRQPCYNLACPNNVCMQSISVDDVLAHIEQIKH